LAAQEYNGSIVVIKFHGLYHRRREWKRNKRIYRKIQSFDCEPAPGDFPELLSKSMPVEVTDLTFELHLPVDSQYSLPVEALNLIVKSKSLPVEVSISTIEFHLPVDSQYSSPVEALHLIVESKSQPVEVNNSTTELHLPVEAKEKLPIILFYTFTPTPDIPIFLIVL